MEKGRKEFLEQKMMSDEEVLILKQQLVAVRNALKESERECVEIRAQLENEVSFPKNLCCAGCNNDSFQWSEILQNVWKERVNV